MDKKTEGDRAFGFTCGVISGGAVVGGTGMASGIIEGEWWVAVILFIVAIVGMFLVGLSKKQPIKIGTKDG